METEKVTLIAQLRETSRRLQPKFKKRKGACINPLPNTKPLQEKKLNQIRPSEILRGQRIQYASKNFDDSTIKKNRGSQAKKTFLYQKKGQINQNINNSLYDTQKLSSINVKNVKNNFLSIKNYFNNENSKSNNLLQDLSKKKNNFDKSSILKITQSNPNTKFNFKKTDGYYHNEDIHFTDSLDKGIQTFYFRSFI